MGAIAASLRAREEVDEAVAGDRRPDGEATWAPPAADSDLMAGASRADVERAPPSELEGLSLRAPRLEVAAEPPPSRREEGDWYRLLAA